MIKTLLSFSFFAILFTGTAQVKIGNKPSQAVNPSAVLELSNDLSDAPKHWKTFLPPQVDFTNPVFSSSAIWGISGSPTSGALVFNVGNAITQGFTGAGLYCWLGNRWTPIVTSSSPADTVKDRLRLALGESLMAYDTAVVNSWVMISGAEYQNLLSVLNGASQYAANDSFMNLPSEIGWNQLYTVGGNAAVSQIPPANYIVAWSVRTGVAFTSSSHNSKIKLSSSLLTGYSDYGPSLPDYALSPDTRYYFILKKPQNTTGALPAYTAVYAFHAKFLGGRLATPGEYFTPGDSPDLNVNYQTQSAAQFICTPGKQW